MKYILLISLIMFHFTVREAFSDIIINDGHVHNIYNPISETVYVYDKNGDPGRYSTVNIHEGAFFSSFVAIYDNSRLNMTGGTLDTFASAYDSSVISLSGGLIRNGITLDNNSEITISDSITLGIFSMTENTKAHINGGVITSDIYIRGNANISITGGQFQGGLVFSGNSKVNISGGIFLDRVSVSTNNMFITGGTFSNIIESGFEGKVQISGGNINGNLVTVNKNVLFILDGTDFTINGQSVDIGSFARDYSLIQTIYKGRSPSLTGHITGVLADGSYLDQTFYLVDQFDGYGNIQFVPEPSSLLIFMVGGMGLFRGRKVKYST